MNKAFRLKNGEISFEEDKIIISDNARTYKYIMLGCNLFCIVCVVNILFSFERLGDTSYNTLFLVLIIVVLIVFVITLLKSTKNTVLLDDVKSIKVKQPFNNTILNITLKNNLKRQVTGFRNAEELKNYINKNFNVN
jgi:ABC-type protease/lipase transport system fused ATPase/permease subunit